MSDLLYEIRAGATGKWMPLVTLTPGDPPGSITCNTLSRRDVIMFRCAGDHSVVERTTAGDDAVIGIGRFVVTAGTEVLATLKPGQSYEADVVSDHGIAYKARWTHV